MKVLSAICLLACLYGCSLNKDQVQHSETDLNQKHQESMAAFALAAQATDVYQNFPSFVNMSKPGQYGQEAHKESQQRRAFIQSCGFPMAEQYIDFAAKHDLKDAIALYKAAVKAQLDNPYLNTLKQYGSWFILTKMNLLATDKTDDILFFTKELVSTEYRGMQLLEFNFGKLDAAGFNKEVAKMQKEVVIYFEKALEWRRNEVAATAGKPGNTPGNMPGPQTNALFRKAIVADSLNLLAYENMKDRL